ncbi:hypothetical protein RclHR1_15190002 [Rhizophagus clarus]|uniref:Tc1-like transposase DDE domain-containing protein n=1 Tax=Rhizophagus clarus TaxID=94130 RepID=A0A2Z6QIS5_9GLOM|nr:hypothetical protein RclHR1_15190002 [Rhizophagus clarus]
MVKTLSNDIRWRIIYHQLDGFSAKETASRQGRKKTLSLADLNILDSLVKDKKDWYLDEMVDEMERLTGKLISIPTLWRALKHLGMTRKKLQKAAKERSELLRSVFMYKIGSEFKPEQLVFIDETSKDERSLSRAYGYSIKNVRVEKSIVFVRVASNEQYPNKNSVIVMDNAKIHHDEKLVESIEQMGCKVLYLPPYSPDYNPIETAFSGIKSWLKRNRIFVESCTDPKYPLFLALSYVTPSMAKGYFSESIYSY